MPPPSGGRTTTPPWHMQMPSGGGVHSIIFAPPPRYIFPPLSPAAVDTGVNRRHKPFTNVIGKRSCHAGWPPSPVCILNHKSHLLEIPYDSVSSEIALTPPPLPHGMSDRSQPSAILRSRWKLGNRHGKRHIITFLPRREGSVRPLCRAIPVCMPVATKGLAGGRHRQGAVPVTPAVRETPVSHHNGD